jgi:hypothetical protein
MNEITSHTVVQTAAEQRQQISPIESNVSHPNLSNWNDMSENAFFRTAIVPQVTQRDLTHIIQVVQVRVTGGEILETAECPPPYFEGITILCHDRLTA